MPVKGGDLQDLQDFYQLTEHVTTTVSMAAPLAKKVLAAGCCKSCKSLP